MMKSVEKNHMIAGGLLIAASLAIGAATGEWTPRAELDERTPDAPALDAPALDAPALDAPALDGFDVTARPVSTPATAPSTAPAEPLLVLEGSASWYSDALAGRRTASGEPYDPSELIAAHRALPFGTRLRVTNLGNDRSVEVRVIDRGPFIAGRIVDLSRSAAEQIGMIRAGHARVKVEILEYPETSLN